MNYYYLMSIEDVFELRPGWWEGKKDPVLNSVLCISIGLMYVSKLIPLLR